MGDGEKPGQMCLLGAEITPDPFPVTDFSPNHPSVFTTPRTAQDKLVEMGLCMFGWVLGVTQLLQALIKLGKRSEQGWGPQNGHRLNPSRGRDCPEGHGEAREVAELRYILVPPTAGDALTQPGALGTAKRSHHGCPGTGGTWWGPNRLTPVGWALGAARGPQDCAEDPGAGERAGTGGSEGRRRVGRCRCRAVRCRGPGRCRQRGDHRARRGWWWWEAGPGPSPGSVRAPLPAGMAAPCLRRVKEAEEAGSGPSCSP